MNTSLSGNLLLGFTGLNASHNLIHLCVQLHGASFPRLQTESPSLAESCIKRACPITELSTSLLKLDIEGSANRRVIRSRIAQSDNDIQAIFLPAGPTLTPILSGVMHQQHGVAPMPQPKNPLLHPVPRLGFVLCASP